MRFYHFPQSPCTARRGASNCPLSLRVQQSPDNHTVLYHTTLLFAPNLPRIKWNVTKFALIITRKTLIIAQFYSCVLHLQPLLVSFCWPGSSLWLHKGSRDQLQMTKSSDFLLQWNWQILRCLNFHPNSLTIGKVVKHECFSLTKCSSNFRYSFHIL